MKKSAYLLASGIAVCFAAPAMAQQQRLLGSVGVGIAISDVTDLDSGMALVLNAGRELPELPGLSLQGEFTTTFVKPETKVLGIVGDVSYWTLGGYGVYTLPVSRQFDLRGRLGVAYESLDGSGGFKDKDEFNVSAGVGANFAINKKVAITADFTRIEADINHYGAGVQFRF